MAKIIWNTNKLLNPTHSKIYINRINFNYIHIFNFREYKRNKTDIATELVYDSYRISKVNISDRLQTHLKITKARASEILENNKQLCRVPPQLITDNYEICKMYGIKKESIINYPELLGQKDFPEKVHLLHGVINDINSVTGLLKVNINDLSEIVHLFDNQKERVLHFSKLLNVTPLEICDYMRKKSFLLKLNLERVTESVQLLKENGISDHEILSDLWVLNYKKSTMEKRIEFVKENNFEKIKTWMIRAPSDIILNYIKIRSENKLILGNNSLAEYLSQRLECPIEQANYIITRLPALKGKSMKKIDETIDYLYSLGMKPIQICITPKVFLHSVETTKKRVQELQEQGVYIDNLRLLTKSQKQYQVYYNKLVSANKMKLRSIK